MSIWAHVAGVIRIDGFGQMIDGMSDEEALDRIIGKELDFNDDYGKWREADEHSERYMPMGSEGSLKRSLWTNPDLLHASRWTLSVFGDLRDCDDVDAVIEWFKDHCEKINSGDFNCIGIRNAVITVECDDGNWAVWSSDGCDEHYLANIR